MEVLTQNFSRLTHATLCSSIFICLLMSCKLRILCSALYCIEQMSFNSSFTIFCLRLPPTLSNQTFCRARVLG
ncbi:hypothetical protein BDD12DRAFT_368897 [Trichophaea hybrida]|nr:hypothetical protein BDD12DRAFT_368897 [Trichophaea hybrida]